jgi:phage N-6-adenine-methyltransferase
MTDAARVLSYRAGGREGRPARKDDWRTPPDLYARLDAEFHFALDAACETHNQLAPAGYRADQGEDGLLLPWHVFGGAVWFNPPYSRISPWMDQGVRCARAGVPAVGLVPADTSTRWWLECVAHEAAEVRFLVGRVRFHLPGGGEHRTKRSGGGLTTPSAIIVYRPSGGPPRYSYMEARP